MSARAGIVVTGTEVLTGRVQDRNGPWLADRLLELGVELAHVTICGDRPTDIEAQLRFLAGEGVDLIVTSGGLGPTADDMTVATVARFCDRELVLDSALEDTIADILKGMMRRSGALGAADFEAVLAANRKQAMVPVGAEILSPVGTAPGVVVPGSAGRGEATGGLGSAGRSEATGGLGSAGRSEATGGRGSVGRSEATGGLGQPTVVVLPGPPRELQPMWSKAVQTAAVLEAIAGRTEYEQQTVRMFGLPESGLAETLRAAETDITDFGRLEITTCLRRGELEIVTRYEPDAAPVYAELVALLRERHGDRVFSLDGSLVDDQVAALLTGRTIATAESCTAGLVAARLTDRAGSSAYVAGGVVSYSNQAKIDLLGVDPQLLADYGAVSEPVAEAMAAGALQRFGADTAVAITGIAGPGGGSADKPVGTVCFSVRLAGGPTLTRTLLLPGDRSDVRERSTTVAMHLLRTVLSPDDVS